MKKGTLLKVRTKTQDDVCGECLYEIIATGLPAPEKNRRAAGETDGVRCRMLGGSGPAARPGWEVQDSEWNIQRDIKNGITSIVPDEQRESAMAQYQGEKTSKSGDPIRSVKHGGAGVVEMEI